MLHLSLIPNTAPKQKSLSFLRGFFCSLNLLKSALNVRFSGVPKGVSKSNLINTYLAKIDNLKHLEIKP